MQNRPRTSLFLSVLLCLPVLATQAFGAENTQPLQASYAIDAGTGGSVYEVALNEVVVRRAGQTDTVTSLVGVNNPSALEQSAAAQAQALGGTAKLVVYPAGLPRTDANRRTVDETILVQLTDNADPNQIAQATGLEYRGSVVGMENHHYFRAASSARALPGAMALRGRGDVLAANPLLGSFAVPLFIPDDPLFPAQWHLQNTGQSGGTVGIDVNVVTAWDKYRGSNIVIAVMDTGTEYIQEDLIPNLLTNAGFDPLDGDFNADAEPGENHGTAVAGVAAARGNNTQGVSGAAPNSSIIPIRILAAGGAFLTEQQQADGLLHSNNVVHVHNNSWGPGTGGLGLAPMGPIFSNAFYQGISFGRGGRGTIFVFSAGNDGGTAANPVGNANYIGQLTTPHSIAIGAMNDLGERATYSNPGANVVVSAPAGLDSNRLPGTTTTDRMGTNGYNPNVFAAFGLPEHTNVNYTAFFNGTSSAAPLVSGCIALILEANPNLGWRDVQDILMRSATVVSTNLGGWATNAAGYHFNHDFGAGMVNVGYAIALAETWTNLPPRTNVVYSLTNLNTVIPDPDTNGVSFTFSVTNEEVRVEHVLLKFGATHPVRGQLEVYLTSPSGMTSKLAENNADFGADYVDWPFMTVRNWGEFADGGPGATNHDWTVRVVDNSLGAAGIVNNLELSIFGSISNLVSISLTNPPSITEHPLSRTTTKGSTVSFRVLANSGAPITAYRWKFTDASGTVDIDNGNRSILQLTNVTSAQQGLYAVEVHNENGVTLSAPATLFVNSPPEILAGSQPTNTAAVVGGTASFRVAAIGAGPLSYQWRTNGVPLANATSATLTLTNVQSRNFVNYDVIVRNKLASVISDTVTLSAIPGVTFTNSVPQLTNGTFSFSFEGASGQTVRIDRSDDFTNWTVITTRVLTSGSGSFDDSSIGTNTSRFYRVVPLP